MLDEPLVQLLILLLATVVVVVAFQRLRIPSSLGYLLVGVLVGPHTPGPVIEGNQLRVLAEFGIVWPEAVVERADASCYASRFHGC